MPTREAGDFIQVDGVSSLAFLILGALIIATGCPAASQPCHCPQGLVCTVRGSCAVSCSDDTSCSTDQSCLLSGDQMSCQCDQGKCPDRAECRGDHCEIVPCGEHVTCADPTQFCVPMLHLCFPLDGDCRNGGVCPLANGGAAPVSHATCAMDTGLCKVEPDSVSVADTSLRIQVEQPLPGDRFALTGPIQFRWDPLSVPVIVLVLAGVPGDGVDFTRLAIWGTALGPEQSEATWGQGYAVSGGTWTDMSPPLPPSGTYYLLVQGLDHGQLTAASVLVPFAIGEAGWKQIGETCVGDGAPSDCDNPSYASACVAGICEAHAIGLQMAELVGDGLRVEV